MRDCYDSLLAAAAATQNSAHGKHYSSHLFVNIAHVVRKHSSCCFSVFLTYNVFKAFYNGLCATSNNVFSYFAVLPFILVLV